MGSRKKLKAKRVEKDAVQEVSKFMEGSGGFNEHVHYISILIFKKRITKMINQKLINMTIYRKWEWGKMGPLF